ncbi:MAG: HepT-like ribonuclease domain-containing protein, partial [Bryobacteraceae bacterium]
SDRQLALALIKEIEIIGEAASRISAETRAQRPDIPWAAIVGMRNRLIHAYAEIDLEVVWSAVDNDLPRLMRIVEELLE